MTTQLHDQERAKGALSMSQPQAGPTLHVTGTWGIDIGDNTAPGTWRYPRAKRYMCNTRCLGGVLGWGGVNTSLGREHTG